MRKSLRPVVGIGVMTMATLFVGHRRYSVSEYPAGGQALWKKDVLYIVSGLDTVGWARTNISELAFWFRALVGLEVTGPQQKLREDLLIWELRDGKLTAYEMADMPSGIQLIPVRGELYGFTGCARPPCPVWHWTGHSLEELPAAEAAAMRSAFRYSRDQVREEGWNEYSSGEWGFRSKPVRLPIETNGRALVLVLAAVGATERTISLEGLGEPLMLRRFVDRLRGISREDYERLSAAHNWRRVH
jgi:hypothetical protein